MGARLTIDQLPAKYQNQIAAQMNAGKPAGVARMEALGKVEVVAPKRMKQHQGDGMNKWEREFFAHLKRTRPNDVHHSQAFSFRIGNGAAYRPDFISINTSDIPEQRLVTLDAWETKGFKREAATVRIKVAASLMPWIKFHLVTKRKLGDGGGWTIEDVNP